MLRLRRSKCFTPQYTRHAMLKSRSSLEGRVGAWLHSIIDTYVPVQPNITGGDATEMKTDVKILAVSHEDPITSLRNILLSPIIGLPIIETELGEGVNVNKRPANTKLAEIRIWRERTGEGNKSKLKARIEAWGAL